MVRYHVMTVGDVGTGRTTLNLSYEFDKFHEKAPSHLPNKVFKGIVIEGYVHECCAYEDHLRPDFENIDEERRVNYSSTEAFIALFEVASRESFESVEKRWIPEIRKYCQNVPIIIVANKIEMRDSNKCKTISRTEGLELAKKMATSYFEVSCLQMKGVEDLFKHAVKLAMLNTPDMREKLKLKSVLYPPIKPLPAPEPSIEVAASTFTKDWQQMFSNLKHTDVKFVCNGGLTMAAHKVVLCSASPFFKKVFIDSCDGSFSADDINYGNVQGIDKISKEDNQVKLELSSSVGSDIFDLLLEFMYTGYLSFNSNDFDLLKLKDTAHIFEVTQLVSHCSNLMKGQHDDHKLGMVKIFDLEKGAAMKDFITQDTFSDISFKLGECDAIPAHRVVVYARCSKMAAMIDERLEKGESLTEIPIPDTSINNFTAFLEYLYTDQPSLENFTPTELCLVHKMADTYGTNRLGTLCEQQLRKIGEKHLEDENELFLLFKFYKAKQMEAWTRHYICHNYAKYSQQEKFLTLEQEDKDYFKKNQNPPVSYLKEQEEFEKKIDPLAKKGCVIL